MIQSTSCIIHPIHYLLMGNVMRVWSPCTVSFKHFRKYIVFFLSLVTGSSASYLFKLFTVDCSLVRSECHTSFIKGSYSDSWYSLHPLITNTCHHDTCTCTYTTVSEDAFDTYTYSKLRCYLQVPTCSKSTLSYRNTSRSTSTDIRPWRCL